MAAERARRAASGEAERARDELVAAKDESARLKAANAGLEKQMASLQADWRSATEAARHNLMVMGEKIEELNVALERARPKEAPAAGRARPEAVEDEQGAVSRAPSGDGAARRGKPTAEPTSRCPPRRRPTAEPTLSPPGAPPCCP